MKKIFFILSISLVCLQEVKAQLPDFMERLDAGSVQEEIFYETIPFKLNHNRIFIEALINTQKYRFLIDTHSPCLLYDYVISESKLDTIDKNSTLGKSFEKTFLNPVFPKIDSFSIGNVTFKDIGAMQMKKNEKNPLKEMELDGILGSNLMKKCIWQLNFSDSTLVLTNNISKCNYINGSIEIPFTPQLIQGSPNVKVTINKTDTLDVQFDTGNNGFLNGLSSIIEKQIADASTVKWTMKLDIPINEKKSDSIESHYYLQIDDLKLGDSNFDKIPMVAYNPSYTQTIGKGSIGVDFLKHFNVTIDWIDNKIYLYPFDTKTDFLHNKKTFGFTYKYSKNKFKINSLFSGSEAEKLGLEIDDEITAINGFNLTNLSNKSIEQFKNGSLIFSSENDKTIKISLLKNGVIKKYNINSYYLF